MSPEQESIYLALMMDVYRRLREFETSRRFVREIVGKGTQEAQQIACVQLYLVTNVHAFAPDDHAVLKECGGRFFEQAVDDRDLSVVVVMQPDEERLALAMKIAPRIIDLEKGPFGLFDEV